MLAPPDLPASVRAALDATRRRLDAMRLARALWPGLFALAVLALLAPVLAALPRMAGSALALAGWAGTGFLFWRGLVGWRAATAQEARLRLEAAAGLAELAPLSGLDDRRAGGDPALWALHRRRTLAALDTLTRPAPWPLSGRDRLGAAALALVALVAALDPGAVLRGLRVDASALAGDAPLRIAVQAEPPAHMGRPAVTLDPAVRDVSLPEGSVIRVRVTGARGAPVLRVPGRSIRLVRDAAGVWTGAAPLVRGGAVRVDRLGTQARWQVRALPDAPPQVTISTPLAVDSRGRVTLGFVANDDTGLASARLLFEPVPRLSGLSRPVPAEVPLEPVEPGAPRQVVLDLSRHALAGLDTRVWLEVTDGAGQTARTPAMGLRLPEPAFTQPLAQAFQEVRLTLLRDGRPYRRPPPRPLTLIDPETGLPIAVDLADRIANAPEGVHRAWEMGQALARGAGLDGSDPVAWLALRIALDRIRNAHATGEAHEVEGALWELALRAEAGDQTPAQQRLAAARRALEQALENGAGEDEIRDLMAEMRAAVGERLDELAQQGSSAGGAGQAPGGETISQEDLARTLDQLESSGASGAREEALAQLEALDGLMQGLMPPTGEGQGSGGGQGSALSDLLRDQRALSDDTGARAGEGAGGPADDLAARQDDLSRRLGGGGQEQQQGRPDASGQARREAREAMGAAAEALRRGDLASAQDAQERAARALRDAARAEETRTGESDTADPLGRPGRARRDDGDGTRVPEEAERQRARDIREELRRRQGDPARPADERDYLDRLLEGQ